MCVLLPMSQSDGCRLGSVIPLLESLPPSACFVQNPTASCSVDLSAVWWEGADSTELCIVTAGETSVALWRRLDSGCWETIHTWSFGEVEGGQDAWAAAAKQRELWVFPQSVRASGLLYFPLAHSPAVQTLECGQRTSEEFRVLFAPSWPQQPLPVHHESASGPSPTSLPTPALLFQAGYLQRVRCGCPRAPFLKSRRARQLGRVGQAAG